MGTVHIQRDHDIVEFNNVTILAKEPEGGGVTTGGIPIGRGTTVVGPRDDPLLGIAAVDFGEVGAVSDEVDVVRIWMDIVVARALVVWIDGTFVRKPNTESRLGLVGDGACHVLECFVLL